MPSSYDRNFRVTAEVPLPAPVPNAGTIIFPYPSGETATSRGWLTTGCVLVDSNGNVYSTGFTVAYGASTITVTNVSLGALPAGKRYRLQANFYGIGQVALDPATYTVDAAGNIAGLAGPSAIGGILNLPPRQKTSMQPWKGAFWGDSRYNAITTTTPDVIASNSGCSQYRPCQYIAGYLGDLEYSRNYAVSGDKAANWASASRTGGKTYIDLNTSDSDIVFIQYGVNDCCTDLTAAATTAANLQNLISEIFKSGKFVCFESILPVSSAASGFAAGQVLIDAVNALMQTWLANFPTQAVYVDVATTFKAGGTYASPIYISASDGLHQTRVGAQTEARLVAAALRQFLPKRTAQFYGPDAPAPNLCNLTSPSPITTQFNVSNNATTYSVTQSAGQDSGGYFYQWLITPTSLATSRNEVMLQMSANFQTANPPYQALVGNEILQGSCRLIVDDGNGGAPPNVYSIGVRQRFYTATLFNDWSQVTGAAASADLDAVYSEKFDQQIMTPKLLNTTASAVANPASGAGYGLQILIDANATGSQYRVKVYNPQLRRVGYSSTPVSSTVGASPATITNTSSGPQQYTFSGGTVSSITLNGVTLGVTSGTFIADPGDVFVVTHTGAPTQVLKQLLTQSTMRGLV